MQAEVIIAPGIVQSILPDANCGLCVCVRIRVGRNLAWGGECPRRLLSIGDGCTLKKLWYLVLEAKKWARKIPNEWKESLLVQRWERAPNCQVPRLLGSVPELPAL